MSYKNSHTLPWLQRMQTVLLIALLTFFGAAAVVPPSFEPGECEFYNPVTVSISIPEGTTVRYTTDGTEPTELYGTVYTNPLTLSGTTTLNAVAVDADGNISDVVSATYTCTRFGMGEDFDPENPGDPQTDLKDYSILTLIGDPVGRFNTTISDSEGSWDHSNNEPCKIEIGSEVSVWAYDVEGYIFKGFYQNNEQVSESTPYSFTMPEHNVELVGRYKFDPSSPGDPETKPFTRNLTIKSSPEGIGSFNTSSRRVFQGETFDVCAYDWNGFVFDHFTVNGEETPCVSENDHRIELTMGERNIEVVGYYRFDPESPTDPSPNLWDPTKGALDIDRFQTGRLESAISSKLEECGASWDMVYMVTVRGVMNENDFGALRNFPNIDIIDISHTDGLTYLPSWAFEYSSVSTVLLPSTIDQLSSYVFYCCENLSSLSIYATMPPEAEESVFYDIDDIFNNCVLHVPEAAIPLYRNHELWGRFLNIEAIPNDLRSVTIQLPEDSANYYRDFTLELTNTLTAAKQKYVIGSKTEYTFSGALDQETYSLALYTPSGYEIARIPSISINGKDVKVAFDAISPVFDPVVKVTLPDGTDVTESVTVEWYELKDSSWNNPYTFLGRSASIAYIPEGINLQCRLTLNDELGRQYALPEAIDMVVAQGQTDETVVLSALRSITIQGNVVEEIEGLPVENATVTANQKVNGLYSKAYATSTDAQGHWTLTILEAPLTTITFAAPEFISDVKEVSAESLSSETLDLGKINLRNIVGARITYTLTYSDAVEAGVAPIKQTYNDYINVEMSVYNKTQCIEQDKISVQYPEIVILGDNVNAGDKLIITAVSKNGKFATMEQEVTVSNKLTASVVFNIAGPGGIKASYQSVNPDANTQRVVGLLYDGNGEFVSKAEYKDFETEFLNLEDDTYTLVTMLKTSRLNTVARLTALEDLGLRSGVDYLQNKVEVVKGLIANISIKEVPALDESAFDHTSKNTTLTINKTSLTTGQYATIKALVNFKEEYADGISDVKIIVHLPQGCAAVDKSAMLGVNFIPYNEEDNTLTFALGQSFNDYLKMCVVPTSGGVKNISAYVEFDYDGQTYRETIGSVSCSAKDLDITVPPITTEEIVNVAGIAKGGAHIDIYDDNTLIGQSSAISTGSWVAECQLPDPVSGSLHNIHAVITNAQGVALTTETKTCEYNTDKPVPEMVDMVFYNGWLHHNVYVHFNFRRNIIEEHSYMFYTRTDLSFILNFNHPQRVKNVVIHVRTTANEVRHLPAIYNSTKKVWVSTNSFDSGALPTNISVTYDIIEYIDVITHVSFGGEGGEFFHNPIPPILDPSGFVYEGDEDNRLEGVQASIYLKEDVEDEFGDVDTRITLWNAEDYGQKNPLFTDALGMYRWDVVEGLWQVKFEKNGYHTTTSEWLPVPPPQLEVNIGMIRVNAPQISELHAYYDAIDIKFDQPMDPATLNTDNIKVTVDGQYVEGDVEYTLGEGYKYVQSCRFVPAEPFDVDKVYLTVGHHVASHAQAQMNSDMTAELDIELEIKSIDAPETATVAYGGDTTLNIAVVPAIASAGRTLHVATSSDMIVSLATESAVIDDEGNASFTITGELPASAQLIYTLDDVDLKAYTEVSVVSTLTEIVAAEELETLVNNPIKASIYALPANVAAGKNVEIAISDPEAMTLSCGTTLTLDDDGYGTFTINPVKGGQFTLTYSITTDEGTLSAASALNVNDYIKGDANGDSKISSADITVIVQEILGNNPANFIFAAADVNQDNKISSSDITGVIDIILNDGASSRSGMNRVAPMTDARYSISNVDYDNAGHYVAQISFNKATESLGTQLDILLPQGVSMEDIQLTEANRRYAIAYREIGDNRVRVIAYSLNGKCFAEDAMFNIILIGECTFENDNQMVITEALYDTIHNGNIVEERLAAGASASFNDITGITDIEASQNIRVYSEGHTLVVESPQEMRMVLTNVAGQYRVLEVKAGVNRFHVGESGLIMVSNHKVIIK